MKRQILWLIGALLLFTACNDSKYELENIVPQEYHKILYIHNSGKQEISLYDTHEDYTYAVNIVKVGSDPALEANVQLELLSPEELKQQYSIPEAINYQRLEEGSYTLSQTNFTFSAGERTQTLIVSLSSDKIKTLLQKDPTAKWVLPLRLISETDSINSSMNELILHITDVIMPTVGFIETEEVVTDEYTFGETTQIEKELELNFITENKWNITYTLGIDQDFVSQYNSEHGTDFHLLEEHYTLPESVKLSEGVQNIKFKVSIDISQIGSGDFMLPIKIIGTDKFGISETSNIYPLTFRIVMPELDRTGWSVTANSENPGEGGPNSGMASSVLDGNTTTFWHSNWGGGSGTQNPPYELIIDAKKEYDICQIGLLQRGGGFTDTKTCKVFISSDYSSWEEAGTFVMESGNANLQTFTLSRKKGRYIKIEMVDSYRFPYCSLAEIYVYGLK